MPAEHRVEQQITSHGVVGTRPPSLAEQKRLGTRKARRRRSFNQPLCYLQERGAASRAARSRASPDCRQAGRRRREPAKACRGAPPSRSPPAVRQAIGRQGPALDAAFAFLGCSAPHAAEGGSEARKVCRRRAKRVPLAGLRPFRER